jgi:hypothetical protein
MKLIEIKNMLVENPDLHIGFVLPDNTPIPAHAHVTDIAYVQTQSSFCLHSQQRPEPNGRSLAESFLRR